MDNIGKITERIVDDAKAEAARIEADAKAHCAEIAAQSDKAAQDEYWKLFRKGTSEAALHLERLNSAAQLEAKKQLLREKQNIISQTFDKAVSMMCSLPTDVYVSFLARLAFAASDTGREEIVLSAADRERCGKAVCDKTNSLLSSQGRRGSLTLSRQTRDIRGGLILINENIEMNCSIETLVGGQKNALSGEVAKILFD